VPGSSEDRDTNEGTAELIASESKPSPALSDRPIYYEDRHRYFPTGWRRSILKLFAENFGQTGSVDVDPTVRVERATVFDEAKHFELLHKEADARACCADHGREGPLRYSGKAVQLAQVLRACEQQKRAGEPPLAAMRNLVH